VRRREYIKYTLGAAALLAASLTGYSYFVENSLFLVTELRLEMDIGKRLIHISNTHLGSSAFSVDKLVGKIEGLKPDFGAQYW